jgi:hypothetical protein
VRITALPTSSNWACPNSPRIVDARIFTVGIGDFEPWFERVGVLHLKGAQVVTDTRQTGVPAEPETTADGGPRSCYGRYKWETDEF